MGRTGGPRWRSPRVPRALLAALAVAVTAGAGAFAGGYAPELAGSGLKEARSAVIAQEARIQLLEERLEDSQARLLSRDRQIAELENALGQSGPLSQQYAEMASQYASLRAELLGLQDQHGALQDEMSSLVRIRTPELPGDALLLDRSVQGVRYTGAVCSGSMEPNITCNDLLLMYEPRVTDLDVGDVIYFRRQDSECNGAMENRFMLHRIIRVVVRSDGLHFQTQGDNSSRPDPCLVPASDVMYKLLANVRNARIQG